MDGLIERSIQADSTVRQSRQELLAETAIDAVPAYHAEAWFLFRGQLEARIRLQEETDDIGELRGRFMLIDDRPFRCIGISSLLHSPPFRAGESVSLAVVETSALG